VGTYDWKSRVRLPKRRSRATLQAPRIGNARFIKEKKKWVVAECDSCVVVKKSPTENYLDAGKPEKLRRGGKGALERTATGGRGRAESAYVEVRV